MSKFKGKLAKRIMAIVLSGAMVMSNMSAYAAELAPETTTEVVSEVEETVTAETTADTAGEDNGGDENNAESVDTNTASEEESAEASEENSEAVSSESKATDEGNEAEPTEEETTEEESAEESAAVETNADNVENKDDATAEGTYELNADAITDVATAESESYTYTASTEIGDYFTINKNVILHYNNSKKSFTVDGTTKEITKRIKLNVSASSTGTASEKSISFSVTNGKTATLTVCAMGDGGLTELILCNSEGAIVKGASIIGGTTSKVLDAGDIGAISLASEAVTVTWPGLTAGNYYITCKRGASSETYPESGNVYYMRSVEIDSNTPTAPTKPNNLEVKDVGTISNGAAESVTLTWNAVTGADAYRVLVCDEALTANTTEAHKLFNESITEESENFTNDNGKISYTVKFAEGDSKKFAEGTRYYFYVYSVRKVDGSADLESDYASCDKKIVSGTETTYVLTPATLASEDYDNSHDDISLADGMLLGDSVYFRAMVGTYEETSTNETSGETTTTTKDGSLKLRYKSSNFVLETSQQASSGLKFAVKGTADITVKAVSTNNTANVSAVALMDSKGTIIYDDDDIKTVTKQSNPVDFKFSDLSEGTYTIISPYLTGYEDKAITDATNPNGRGAQIRSVSVTETSNRAERADWSSGVTAPTVKSVTWHKASDSDIADYTPDSITVVATGVVGYDGGDKLTLKVTKAGGTEPPYTDVSRVETTSENNETTFTIPAGGLSNGEYNFEVALSRKGETDLTGSYSNNPVTYDVSLSAPDGLSVTRDGSVTDSVVAAVSWNVVADATKYNLAVYDITDATDLADDAVPTGTAVFTKNDIIKEADATTVSVSVDTGLAEGKTYRFCVYSVNDTETSKKAAIANLKIAETVAGTYVFEASGLSSTATDPLYTTATNVPAGTSNYFTVACSNKSKTILANTNADNKLVFDDGDYTPSIGLQFGGSYSATSNHIKFTTSGSAIIKVWWATGSDGRTVALYDSSGANELSQGSAGSKATPYTKTFEVSDAGTYIIGSSTSVGSKGDIRIYKIEVTEGVSVNVTKTFDAASVYTADKAAGTWKDGDTETVDNYFTVIYSEKAKVEKKSYTGSQAWSDDYTGGYRLNFGDVASTGKNAIKFTTTEQEATVKVWWKAGADGRHVQLLGADGNQVAVSSNEEGEGAASKKDESYITKFKLTAAGTYYLGNETGNNYLFKVVVIEGHEEDPVPWDTVAKPVIKSAVQTKDTDGKLIKNIDVTFAALIDEIKGCEKVTVEMYDVDPSQEGNAGAEPIASASSSKTTSSAEGTVTVSLAPDASGIYYFVAKASRAEEKTSIDSDVYTMTEKFILPLTKPSITRATNDGKGGVEIAYSETPEAEKYVATAVKVTKNEDGTYSPVEGAEPKTAESVVTPENKATTATFEGLEIGQYYAYTVHAVRGEDTSAESEAFYKIVKDVPEQVWDYSSFGESTSTNKDQCGYSGDVNDGEVSVWSLGGKGKIVPASTDGVSFLYTKIDKDTNFVLEATACVDEWTYSNGQEGFGLMVADTVGPHGHGTKFWNNSYMAVATKMEYYWNGSTVLSADVGPGDDRVRYNMYLGLGSIARTGVTDEWEKESAAGATIPSKFVSQMLSLEHAAGSRGLVSGDYNVIGNAKSSKSGCIDVSPLTEIKLRIEKNNTGYFISYINGDEITTHKYYEDRTIVDKDYANQSLLQIDKENIYVGFFAARNAKATFKDISFTTSSVDDGGEPQEKPLTYNAPSYTILSGSVANSPEYEILFNTNWYGTLSVKDAAGRELVNEDYFKYLETTMTTRLNGGEYETVTMFDKFFECEYEKNEDGSDKLDENGKKIRIAGTEVLKADVKAIVPIIKDGVNSASQLSIGGNQFTITFTPERSWHKNGDELQVLSSYATSVQTLNVSYRKYGEEGNNIYVAPDGKASNDGTPEAPLDIFTAVKYVQPGQTIVLKAGTYNLKKVLTIERGIDGTADKPIRMIAEPGSYDRTNPFAPSGVVIDFNGVASGMTIAGDYWYFRGFDVTHSSDGNKGIQVSGSYNVLDQVNTYYNGNTGIQVNRYRGTDIDKSDDWPHDNLILNCTSYLNADSGVEDADGFAAKLTIGDNNVFDGCIAAYNADDGWDLFAKSESGPIGQVVIKNSVAFKNGYVLRDNDGNLNIESTKEVKAGNGNGFKMGGESIKGYHLLINSYSFYNKAKGIDANSCPDIQAYNSISFNNMGYNVAFYTGVAKYTEHKARNVISFRTANFTPDSGSEADQLKPVKGKDPNGVERTSDYDVDSNYFYRAAGKSANMSGTAVTAAWFKSLEYTGVHTVSRNENGTINLGDFLALTDTAKAEAAFVKLAETTNWSGFKTYDSVEGEADLPSVGGQASNDDNAKVDSDKNTEGGITSGDDEDTSSTDVWTQEEFDQLDANGNTLKILLNMKPLVVDDEGYYHMAYTGLALKPAVRVAYGLNELNSKNYSVSYKNNTKAYELRPGDAGFDAKLAPTVVIKGKGNYAGEYNLYFVIDKIDMGSDKVVSADITTVATGKAQKINPIVTFSGKKLGAKDYTVNRIYTKEPVLAEDGTETGETIDKAYSGSYESAGTYYIELKAYEDANGIGNFKGTKTIKVTVLSEADVAGKTPMSKAKVDKIIDQIYDGNEHKPAVTVSGLTASKTNADGSFVQGDYDVAYYDNTDIGVASVVLTGNLEKGYYGTKTVTFKIIAKPFNVKDYSVSVKYNKKYYTSDEDYKSLSIPSNGSAVTFGNVIVKVISTDKQLEEGVDYTVSYKGNNKAGNASIVIKGKGDFKGSMNRTFKVEPLEISGDNVTVEPIGDQVYTKGGVKPSVIVKVKATGKVISPSNYSVSYKNNNAISALKGPASVSITGKNLLKGSIKDAQTFTITPKSLRYTDIIAENVYYGTAKSQTDNGIAYITKLAVKDSKKTLSLNSDYAVTYYTYEGTGAVKNVVFDYKTGEIKLKVLIKNEDGTEKEDTVAPKKLEKNDKIKYDGSNKTIYAVITEGKNGLYTGASYTSYKVVGKNDLRYAKITKIVTTETYNDAIVAAPKLTVQIQNRKLVEGKYVKDPELKELKLNEDYEIVDIKNNDRAGSATITIKGIGYYCGTNKVTFKIDKKDLTAWDAYIAHAVVENITVEVDEADIASSGKYKGVITFDDIIIKSKDEEGKDVETKETSPLAKAAAEKIYMVGTKTSTALKYGTDYIATDYTNNKVDVSKLTFDETTGYAYQPASVTITATEDGSYTGSRTIQFTIKIKKKAETV